MSTKKRPDGSGWVETRPGRRPRARFRDRHGRLRTFTCDSEEDAERLLDGMMVALAQAGEHPRGMTFGEWMASYLDQRELQGYRTITADRSRSRNHIEKTLLAETPIRDMRTSHVVRWRDGLLGKRTNDRRRTRSLSRSTVHHCLVLVRRALAAAHERGLVETNWAKTVELPDARTKRTQVDDTWTYLTLAEQQAIADSGRIPDADRLRILFAVFTGLRQGEQWNLELADLVVDGADPHVMVRYGGPNHEPPKSGKIRRVPLIGHAVAVARAWLDLLPTYAKKNPHRLVFPTPRGARRQRSKTYGWKRFKRLAGITRNVRWHDLRHTCASSLVAGWWGRSWTLLEVRDFLGHTDIRTTQRYAHLAPTALRAAADETNGGSAPPSAPPGPQGGGIAGQGFVLRSQRSQVRILPGAQRDSQHIGGTAAESWGALGEQARLFLEAVAARSPAAAAERARFIDAFLALTEGAAGDGARGMTFAIELAAEVVRAAAREDSPAEETGS